MRLTTGVATDVGRLRPINQDAYVVDERLALFALADGMGGHRAGEVASWTAIEALRAAVASGRAINDAVSMANDAVFEKADTDPEFAGMGTTMTAVVVAGNNALLIGHVGDSRAYLLHDGNLTRVTQDHSLVEELVREGRITPEQAESHPQRAIVTRALGVDPEVEVDVYTIPVVAGDRLLVCSDGLTDMVRERDIERMLRAEADPQRAAEALVAQANEAGGVDNITTVLVDVVEIDAVVPFDPESVDGPIGPTTPAPTSPPDEPPAPPAVPRKRRSRRVARVLLVWMLPVVLVIGAAFAAVGYYARRTYFVGLDGTEVVVYRGVPGGVLGWDPTIERRTGLTVDELIEADRDNLRGGAAQGSHQRADDYVVVLQRHIDSTTTTTTSTTTTTRPKRSTSTTRPRRTTTTTVRPPVGP